MKKILTILMVLAAAFVMSANAQMIPSWVENLSAGQSYTYGTYSASKGLAEGAFTPTTFDSALEFGDGVTGALIEQELQTSITGQQLGSVDRQLFGQSATAYAAYNDVLSNWDPEKPNAQLVAQMGLTKNQFALFSGALTQIDPELVLDQGTMTPAGQVDPHGGGHNLQWWELANGVDPSWTTTYYDDAEVTTPTATLYQETDGASVTISANPVEQYVLSPDPMDVFQINDVRCVGESEVWVDSVNHGVNPDLSGAALLPFISVDPALGTANAQLTEVASSFDSDVTLTQTVANNNNGPQITTSLAGSASLGGQFANAFLTPGTQVGISFSTPTPISYWWA